VADDLAKVCPELGPDIKGEEHAAAAFKCLRQREIKVRLLF
jgi:hypothetical protein